MQDLEQQQQPHREERSSLYYAGLVLGLILVVVVGTSLLVLAIGTPSSLTTMFSPKCESYMANVNVSAMHKELRKQVSEYFDGQTGALFIAGADVSYRYDTDVEQMFRQESNFLYFTGYEQPNATVLYDIKTAQTSLFIPDRPVDYAVWNGAIEDPLAIEQTYGFDHVYYHFQFGEVLANISKNQPRYTVYVLPLQEFRIPAQYSIDNSQLQSALYGSRTTKTDMEIELLRVANNVSSDAHINVMKMLRPQYYEYNVEATFIGTCLDCGLMFQAYIPIIASGNNSAILHYNANDKEMKDGSLLLIDAGGEYHGYGADITRTMPVNGKYTATQQEIYEMVLDIQDSVFEVAKPGTTFTTLQDTTNNGVCAELIAAGYVTGTQSECIDNRIYYLFMPHGVSHYVGLDVHDRYMPPRTLAARNVITVEPGIYFNNALLIPAFSDPIHSKYLVKDKIEPLLQAQFGGVRIEDDILITENGYERLSHAPRTVEDIERVMNQ